MVKVIKTLTMKWVLDGSRRVELIDNGVADKIAYNKSGGDVLHCTTREGDGSLRCISICNRNNFCSHPQFTKAILACVASGKATEGMCT